MGDFYFVEKNWRLGGGKTVCYFLACPPVPGMAGGLQKVKALGSRRNYLI